MRKMFNNGKLSPLKREWVLNFNKLESLLPKDALYQVWIQLEIKEVNSVKSLLTDGQTDRRTPDKM